MSESPPARNRRGRPLTPATRSTLGGLEVVAQRGSGHMAAIGRQGSEALDRRIAAAAGIPPDAPDYAVRLKAARTAYYIRLSHKAAEARTRRARRAVR